MNGQLAHYYRVKAEMVEKLGGKCVSCGTVENLEFDHIDPSTKSFSIGSKIRCYAKVKILEEVKKCQLLCKSCHREKNKVDNGEAQHGSLTMYTHYKCRCKPCKKSYRAWANNYKREWRRKRKEQGLRVT